MYPACLIGSRVVALMGNTHAPLVSLADRLLRSHSRRQTPSAFIHPFHSCLIANLLQLAQV